MAKTSRKPAHLVGRLDTRETVWEAIRAAGGRWFTLAVVADETRLDRSTVRDYLKGLVAAKYLEAEEPQPPQKSRLYRLIKDVGVEAPRVRVDGTTVTMGRGRENLWRALKRLGEFTIKELALAASDDEHQVAEREVETYICFLVRAGYLVSVDKGRWRMPASKWTGPRPPMIQRTKQLYDPNLGKVVWRGGVE